MLPFSGALSQQERFLIRQQIPVPLILQFEFADSCARIRFCQAQPDGQESNCRITFSCFDSNPGKPTQTACVLWSIFYSLWQVPGRTQIEHLVFQRA
jgi:hypothetical protein